MFGKPEMGIATSLLTTIALLLAVAVPTGTVWLMVVLGVFIVVEVVALGLMVRDRPHA